MAERTTDIYAELTSRYAAAARSSGGGCCDDGCCEDTDGTQDSGDFGTWLYAADQLDEVPNGAALASLGCGNPTAVAELHPGEIVLDLGSGAGLDVLLSARRVGASGFAYGIDMTDEMLELAMEHQRQAGISNVEFRKGVIENIPLSDSSVDVIISNCVINLSPNKPAVFAEMYRVLRPGGRFGIADVVAEDTLTKAQRLGRGSWVGCVAGALGIAEYGEALRAAGFSEISIDTTHSVAEQMHAAIVRGTKP